MPTYVYVIAFLLPLIVWFALSLMRIAPKMEGIDYAATLGIGLALLMLVTIVAETIQDDVYSDACISQGYQEYRTVGDERICVLVDNHTVTGCWLDPETLICEEN